MGKDRPRDGEKILYWDGITKLDLPVSRVLGCAMDSDLEEVVVVGYEKNGNFYFSGSKADGAYALWLLEMAKKKLLDIGDCDEKLD